MNQCAWTTRARRSETLTGRRGLPENAYEPATCGSRYAAEGLPAGVKIPSTASSASALRVLDDVHLARAKPERDAGRERLRVVADVEPALPAQDPDDLVVEVVVPRRLPGRDVADEHRRPRRPVVRAVEHLERPRSGRLARLDVVERDDRLGRAHRGVQVGAGAERDAHALEAVGAGNERSGSRRPARTPRRRRRTGSSPSEPEPVWTKRSVSCSSSVRSSDAPGASRSASSASGESRSGGTSSRRSTPPSLRAAVSSGRATRRMEGA